MTHQADIRRAYALTRCALIQAEEEFRAMLRQLLDPAGEKDDAKKTTPRLRQALEDRRLCLRDRLRDLSRINARARQFPGLVDRAIEDAYRLYGERRGR